MNISWLQPAKTPQNKAFLQAFSQKLQALPADWPVKALSLQNAKKPAGLKTATNNDLSNNDLSSSDLLLLLAADQIQAGKVWAQQTGGGLVWIAAEDTALSPEEAQALLQQGIQHVLWLSQPTEQWQAQLLSAYRQKKALQQAKNLAEQMTELNSQLYERNNQVEVELYTARQLQQSLLPSFLTGPEGVLPDVDPKLQTALPKLAKCHYNHNNIRITGIYMPCDALGGDLYDVLPFKDGAIGVSVIDVSGHGVPAGFVTAIFKASFYRATHMHQAPGEILHYLNNELSELVKTGHYVTGFYARLNPDQQLLFSGAGHPYPLYYQASSQTVQRLSENGSPLAWFADMAYETGKQQLQPGDKILLFTDGVSEMKNTADAILTEETLETLFAQAIEQAPNRVLDFLMHQLSDFAHGHPLDDDLSMVLIEVLP